MAEDEYVDFHMQEWRMNEYPTGLQACVRKVLGELSPYALLCLKDPRFDVLPRNRFIASGPTSRSIESALLLINCGRNPRRACCWYSAMRVLKVNRKSNLRTTSETTWGTSCCTCAPQRLRTIAPTPWKSGEDPSGRKRRGRPRRRGDGVPELLMRFHLLASDVRCPSCGGLVCFPQEN
jgi:hypothetical protein